MEFQFISFSDPNEIKTRDTRRRIRSHAMQHVRNGQRQRSKFVQAQPNPQPAPSSEGEYRAPISPPRSPPWNITNARQEGDAEDEDSDIDIAGVARMEQLEVYPVSTTQRYMFTIFHHYGTAVAGGHLPLGKFIPSNPLRTKVLSLVMHDKAIFHSIMAESGMDMMTWRGEPFFDPVTRSNIRGRELGTRFCMKHKMEAIRIINKRLNNGNLAVSDETMLAVLHIVCYEMLDSGRKSSEAKFTEFKIHMDGIEQMVRMRGGLRAIGLNTCVAQLILRMDHLYTALTDSYPRFTVETFEEDDTGLNPAHELRESNPRAAFNGIANPVLLQVLSQTCDASQFINSLEDPVSENDFFTFGLKRARIEDNIFKLRNLNISEMLSPIEQCCLIAALLYVETSLTKVNCKVYGGLVTSLRLSIERTDLETISGEHSNLVLWMLLVGGGAAGFNADRPWFMDALKRSLHTSSWEEVEQRLQGWPWRPKYCVPWRAIWREALLLDLAL